MFLSCSQWCSVLYDRSGDNTLVVVDDDHEASLFRLLREGIKFKKKQYKWIIVCNTSGVVVVDTYKTVNDK